MRPTRPKKPKQRAPRRPPKRERLLEPLPAPQAAPETWPEEPPPPPRAFVGWLASLLAVVCFEACVQGERTYATVCDEAEAIVQGCGATVPLLEDTPCTGLPKLVSRCVADHARGCDDLAELARNPDRCFPDAGELPEPEPLPVPEPDPLDGGTT
ncbi:MAG: hypothetical protein JNK82_15485 [Myxococcaceae bacterium]|nr:hypothetical protein [Myxococcaceae bacterium]